MSQAHPTSPRAILLDIEGTTTAVSFVYDTLFPFARRAVAGWLAEHWGEPRTAELVALLRGQADADLAEGHAGAVAIPGDEAGPEAVRAAVVASVHWQMDADRKTTALKALQGHIWRNGYARRELRGHVYEDVAPTLQAWTDRGLRVCIYSSGSVAAQELLFSCSTAGDLTPLLSGYFDTTTGPKKEAASYIAIAAALELAPEAVVFATDNLDEARAARAAGMEAVVAVRPGNAPLPDHDFREIRTLDQLVAGP